MQLLLQSSIADAVVEVLTKGVLELIKIVVITTAVTTDLDQTSDDKNPYDVKSKETSYQPEVKGE